MKAFLETAAPLGANVVFVLEIAMGMGLLLGARLARKGRFRQHARCQSTIVLLNLAVVVVMVLSAGTKALPEKLRITKYKAWMRSVLVLWWVVLLLGMATYTRWYVPHLFSK